MNLPQLRSIIENSPQLFVLMGDEAFLTLFMMWLSMCQRFLQQRNLQQKVFNYLLSRARRIVECAFGILTARWRIFWRFLSTNVDNTIALVKGTICLHNFLMQKNFTVSAEKKTNIYVMFFMFRACKCM